ncbi:hypothetical protein [Litoreibacter halocynthiae]|uniref:hypothetical protein n=1 Tax=Litoreibacter halocynthiae TaxID=1242689 RepID=UPI002492A416|nr:hypothetical protein [Litoreibacter halocynthiae]
MKGDKGDLLTEKEFEDLVTSLLKWASRHPHPDKPILSLGVGRPLSPLGIVDAVNTAGPSATMDEYASHRGKAFSQMVQQGRAFIQMVSAAREVTSLKEILEALSGGIDLPPSDPKTIRNKKFG